MHNPTGTSTDIAVASRLLQLAERHDMLVVEDDVFGDLYPGAHPLHLAQIDRLCVIYVSSFCKVISPNIRVGYLVAPPAFVETFVETMLLSILSTSEFDERLVYEMLVEGGYRKHIERVRMRLVRQWPGVVKGLREAGWLRVSAASGNDPRLFDYLRVRLAALAEAGSVSNRPSGRVSPQA